MKKKKKQAPGHFSVFSTAKKNAAGVRTAQKEYLPPCDRKPDKDREPDDDDLIGLTDSFRRRPLVLF